MSIEKGQIVKNLIPSEPVTITKIQPFGDMFGLDFTGVNSKKASNKVIDKKTYDALEILVSVIDPLPHQIEAVYKYLLPQPKIRFLLADDTGAGKTIMTGIPISLKGPHWMILSILPSMEKRLSMTLSLHPI